MDSSSIENLTKLVKTPIRAIIIDVRIDVRRDDAYAAASGVIPGDASAATSWASGLELAPHYRLPRRQCEGHHHRLTGTGRGHIAEEQNNQLGRLVMSLTVFLMLALAASPTASFAQSELDTAKIEQVIGVKGAMIPAEHVFKVTKARNDVKVQVDGWSMPPFMGLGSWAAFTPSAHGVMVMGDTVLFEDEVNPAMSAALESGLEVTALHNHFFFDQPRVYFMHIAGMGDEAKLAAGVKAIWDKIAEIRAANPIPAKAFGGPDIAAENAIAPAPLEAILGVKGQASQGMFKVVIGKPASMQGTSVGKEMGVNTWAAFGGRDNEAVIDGDFAMTENELQPCSRPCARKGSISSRFTST